MSNVALDDEELAVLPVGAAWGTVDAVVVEHADTVLFAVAVVTVQDGAVVVVADFADDVVGVDEVVVVLFAAASAVVNYKL